MPIPKVMQLPASFQGYGGQAIGMHRALHSWRFRPASAASGALIAVGLTMLYAALYPWLVSVWAGVLDWGVQWLALPAKVRHWPVAWTAQAGFSVDRLVLAGRLPAMPNWSLLLQGAVVIAIWPLTGRLRDSLTPVAYGLRLLAVLHGVAVVYFWFWGDEFPYRLADHTRDIYAFNAALQWLTPLVLALTLFPIEASALKRVGACLVVQGYFATTLPFKILAHAWLAIHLGAVSLPMLFLALGPTLDVLQLVALFAWAVTWGAVPAAPAVVENETD